MNRNSLESLQAEISSLKAVRTVGRVSAVQGNTLRVSGLSASACLGDRVRIRTRAGAVLTGEVLQLETASLLILPDSAPEGVALGDRVLLLDAATIAPTASWIGRIIDPFGEPLDGRPLLRGPEPRALRADPPAPARRRALGARLETGMAAFNTVLPIVRGQRVGLFAGSGVGKSMLLGHMARNMQADVVVIALIGERGRELREFVENVLGPEGMKRAVIVAATSDRSPLIRRRCAWAAMSVAEYFRDQGLQVLFLADSITRFAEAHREVATAAGEMPALRGFPASTAHMIMSLCERAGPGESEAGDITALLTVLVAGSDMEEPIADILRGVLDGHVVLDRQIAERGRYPAIDLLRSVSRSLPHAASAEENALIKRARGLLGSYARSETMVKAGLYVDGSDPELDQAIKIWGELDGFLAEEESVSSQNSFARLAVLLRRAGGGRATTAQTSARTETRPSSQPTRRPQ
ncbi:MAG: FliI/YscN family ATPase [Roseovarius sp.]|nr:FliI/YscN family ATPase [Roseovarius sp.]